MNQLLRKARIALTPRSCFLKARLQNGVVVYGLNKPGYGGRGVYLFRDDLEVEFRHLDKLLNAGDVLIDVGANTGIYSLKAASLVGGTGVVVSIEPFPQVLAALSRSVMANGFQNVRLRNFCAGDSTEEQAFWMNRGLPNSFSLEKSDEQSEAFSVLKVKLDDLMQWEKLDRLDFLKIDAEGAEGLILKGAHKTLRDHRPIIVAEISRKDVAVAMDDYLSFQAEGSINKVFMPKEHSKVAVARELGWKEIPTN